MNNNAEHKHKAKQGMGLFNSKEMVMFDLCVCEKYVRAVDIVGEPLSEWVPREE